MRVFVLCTGRTGSATFAAAAAHATNFTAAHESRINVLQGRLDYPDQHIEVDNRLSWFTGSLARAYPDAFYVHLSRDKNATVDSYLRRFRDGWPLTGRLRTDLVRAFRQQRKLSITDGFAHSILYRDAPWPKSETRDVVQLMVETMNDNIENFLIGRDHMSIDIDSAAESFPRFWREIGAEGDLNSALSTFGVRHNATGGSSS